MAIGNGELMHDCYPQNLCMGTARIKLDKEADEDGKKRGVSMEERPCTHFIHKRRSTAGLSQPDQNTIIVNIIW